MDGLENTGVTEQAAAAQTDTSTDTTQAASAGETGTGEDTGVPATAGQGSGQQTQQETQHQTQTPEVDSQFAAARREAEGKLAAYQQKVSRDREIVKQYGAVNGVFSDEDVSAKFGAQGITTLEQLASEVERQTAIQRGEPDPKAISDLVNQAVANNPVVKAAQEAQSRSAAEKMISDFKADFPDVAIDPQKGYEQFGDPQAVSRYLGMGLSLSEAYSLLNGKALRQKSAAAATQAAINSINSKGHLAPTGAESLPEDEVDVPEDVMAIMKSIPQLRGKSDSWIRKEYAKRHPKKK